MWRNYPVFKGCSDWVQWVPGAFLFACFLFPAIVYAEEEQVPATFNFSRDIEFTARFGQGGFRDSRSPLGELGGGQTAIDIYHVAHPVGIGISSEYYTNSPDATGSWEISSLDALELKWRGRSPFPANTSYFLAAGGGRLEVPINPFLAPDFLPFTDTLLPPRLASLVQPENRLTARHYVISAGLDYQPFEHLGFYATARYLSSQRKYAGLYVIDFRENILLLGLTWRFHVAPLF